jgi:hypothetical protein
VRVLLRVFKKLYPEVDFSLNILDRENLFRRLQDNLDNLYLTDQVPANIEVESIPCERAPINGALVYRLPKRSTHAAGGLRLFAFSPRRGR